MLIYSSQAANMVSPKAYSWFSYAKKSRGVALLETKLRIYGTEAGNIMSLNLYSWYPYARKLKWSSFICEMMWNYFSTSNSRAYFCRAWHMCSLRYAHSMRRKSLWEVACTSMQHAHQLILSPTNQLESIRESRVLSGERPSTVAAEIACSQKALRQIKFMSKNEQ